MGFAAAIADVEFEGPRNHDHGFRLVAVFEKGELDRLVTVGEEATAEVRSILGNPVALSVLSDEEDA